MVCRAKRTILPASSFNAIYTQHIVDFRLVASTWDCLIQNRSMVKRKSPTVLLTNDDGPPAKDSPFILSFVESLHKQLGWTDVRVVIPSSQKSWIVSTS